MTKTNIRVSLPVDEFMQSQNVPEMWNVLEIDILSGSFQNRISNLEFFSSSLDATYATDAELSSVSSSFSSTITTDSSSFESRITSQEEFSSSLDATYATDAELSSVSSSIVSTISSSVLYDTTPLSPSLEMPEAVGGIAASTTVADLTGKSYNSLFNDILFPTVNPTFVNPSSTFTDNVSALYEVSESINITFTSTFNQGQILINGVEDDKRSGLPNTFTYTGTDLPVSVTTSSLTNQQTVSSYHTLEGNQSWTNSVSYDEGPQPINNKGINFDSPLAAGTTSTDTITIEGVYPLFGTTSNITTATKQALKSMISANNIQFGMVAESGGNKQFVDIPDVWLASRSLTAIETYNTLTTNWEYQGGSAVSSLTFWTTSTTTQTIQGNVINYTRYTYNGSDRGAVDIRLVF